MNQPNSGMDPLLLPLLGKGDVFASEQFLAELISKHADPVIYKIIKAKLRVPLSQELGSKENQDALELAGSLRALLIAELRELQNSATNKNIASFPDYVAIKTFSACADYFRERNPNRSRLKNLLRRHLKQQPQFALWRSRDKRWLAGFSDSEEVITEPDAQGFDHESDDSAQLANLARGEVPPSIVDQLLTEIFSQAGAPLPFERVVAIAAERWDIKDLPDESVSDEAVERTLVDWATRIDLALEQRIYLKSLWAEVCQLPTLQRSALLLNLRDLRGGSVISFIPFLGIATKVEIANLVALPMERFESIWTQLPLDDSSLADLMNLTRQQVINLRKTARERLARRMKKWDAVGDSGKKRD